MRILILSCIQSDLNGNDLTHFHKLASLFQIGIIKINCIQRIVPDEFLTFTENWFLEMTQIVCVQNNRHDSFKTMPAHSASVCEKLRIIPFLGQKWKNFSQSPAINFNISWLTLSINAICWKAFDWHVFLWTVFVGSCLNWKFAFNKTSSMMEIQQNRLFDVFAKIRLNWSLLINSKAISMRIQAHHDCVKYKNRCQIDFRTVNQNDDGFSALFNL